MSETINDQSAKKAASVLRAICWKCDMVHIISSDLMQFFDCGRCGATNYAKDGGWSRGVLIKPSLPSQGGGRESKAEHSEVLPLNAQERTTVALKDLLGFLDVTPLRLNEDDSITLSMIIDTCRAALEKGKNHNG